MCLDVRNLPLTHKVIQNIFFISSFSLPKPTQPIQVTKDALSTLETTIAETYLEHKGDPLVGTIEPSMYMGRHKTDVETPVDDARPYVYEIINNLIAVHAEVYYLSIFSNLIKILLNSMVINEI